MHKNVMDVMTIIPINEIVSKGIPYVRSILESNDLNLEQGDLDKWAQFWEYFESYWCSSEEFMKTWNVRDEDNDDYDLRNRTNNGLERYNRSMNDLFPTPHPSLSLFVQTIEKESRRIVKRLDDIRRGHVVVGEVDEAIIGEIPLCNANFVPPQFL